MGRWGGRAGEEGVLNFASVPGIGGPWASRASDLGSVGKIC